MAKSIDAIGGLDAEDQVQIDQTMIELDGTPNKARLGANAILGVSLAVAKAAAQSAEPAALQYVGGVGARLLARADDEHRQWRRPCRQSDRLPGIHDPAGRRRDLRRGAAHGRRDLPHPEEGAEGGRPQHQCRRRGRLRAEPAVRQGGARLHHEGDREGRLQGRARTSCIGLDCAATEFFKDGVYDYEGEGKRRDVKAQVEYLASLAADYPDRDHRGRHGRGRLRRLEAAHRQDRQTAASWSATTSSSPTASAWRWASSRASPMRSWSRSTRSAR